MFEASNSRVTDNPDLSITSTIIISQNIPKVNAFEKINSKNRLFIIGSFFKLKFLERR